MEGFLGGEKGPGFRSGGYKFFLVFLWGGEGKWA